MAKASETLVATDTFAAEVDGETVVVHAGTRVGTRHPLAKAHGHMFEQADKPKSRGRRKTA